MTNMELAGDVRGWEEHADLVFGLIQRRLGLKKRVRGPVRVPATLN